MPLFKEIEANLSKILTQSKKVKNQLEKNIISTKTSIKSIKDLKLNVKELKLSNDQYNKALQKFNSTKLLKKIDNYLKLENPTKEETLKLKNQINVSNNYLTKANTVFSENKTFSDKAFDSFNKYKNNNSIGNAEKSIELKQRLILSFKKNNKITTPTIKLKTQSRKVYYFESPTPSPECQKLKKDLADKIKERDDLEELLNAFDEKTKLADKYKKAYEDNNKDVLQFIKTQNDLLLSLSEALNEIEKNIKKLSKVNEEISKLLKKIQISEVPNEADANLLKALLSQQKTFIGIIEFNTLKVGPDTEESLSNEYIRLNDMKKESEMNSNDYKEWEIINSYIIKNKDAFEKLKENKQKLTTEISDLRKLIEDLNCN